MARTGLVARSARTSPGRHSIRRRSAWQSGGVTTYDVSPIGWVRSSRDEAIDDDWESVSATITLDPDRFSRRQPGRPRGVLPRRGRLPLRPGRRGRGPDRRPPPPRQPGLAEVGIFAQRAKMRPNRLGVTVCRLLGVDDAHPAGRGARRDRRHAGARYQAGHDRVPASGRGPPTRLVARADGDVLEQELNRMDDDRETTAERLARLSSLSRREIIAAISAVGAAAFIGLPERAAAATRRPPRPGRPALRRRDARGERTGRPSTSVSEAAAIAPAGGDLGAIEHIVFLMLENRSYDHYFGAYPAAAASTTTRSTRSACSPRTTRAAPSCRPARSCCRSTSTRRSARTARTTSPTTGVPSTSAGTTAR